MKVGEGSDASLVVRIGERVGEGHRKLPDGCPDGLELDFDGRMGTQAEYETGISGGVLGLEIGTKGRNCHACRVRPCSGHSRVLRGFKRGFRAVIDFGEGCAYGFWDGAHGEGG